MKQELGKKHWSGRGTAIAGFALFGLAAIALMTLATPSVAQDAGAALWGRGGCAECHGGLAAGGGGGEAPAGPNLRRTRLDRAAVRETIACGRGEMPYHLKGAYTEVPCYGIPVPGPAGAKTGTELTAAELDALLEFLFKNVVGVTTITRANCATFFGGDTNHPACAQYR